MHVYSEPTPIQVEVGGMNLDDLLITEEDVIAGNIHDYNELIVAQRDKTVRGIVKWLQERTYGYAGWVELTYKTIYEDDEWEELQRVAGLENK